jgi:hypothetical protein
MFGILRPRTFRYARDHLSTDDYAAFFADCKTMPWSDAIERLLARPSVKKSWKIPRFLKNQRRNDFTFLLPIHPDSVVLDFGSGWGNSSYTLSQYCARVVAMEGDRDRRTGQRGILLRGRPRVHRQRMVVAGHVPPGAPRVLREQGGAPRGRDVRHGNRTPHRGGGRHAYVRSPGGPRSAA